MEDVIEIRNYYLLAKEFGWRPVDVDEMPAEFVDSLITYIEEAGKKQEQDIRKR
jgi:hypothetical protein